MRKILALTAAENLQLLVKFDDGTQKKFNFAPYLRFPVFSVFKNEELFKQVANRVYFIEWQPHEIDLSADTLWHEGVEC